MGCFGAPVARVALKWSWIEQAFALLGETIKATLAERSHGLMPYAGGLFDLGQLLLY